MPDPRHLLEQGQDPVRSPEDRTQDVHWQATPLRRGLVGTAWRFHQQIAALAQNGDTRSATRPRRLLSRCLPPRAMARWAPRLVSFFLRGALPCMSVPSTKGQVGLLSP